MAEYKVICFHECVTGYGATRGDALRPQPGTRDSKKQKQGQAYILYGWFCNNLFLS